MSAADASSAASKDSARQHPAVTVVPFDPARDTEPFARTMVRAFDDTEVNHAMWRTPRPSLEDRIRASRQILTGHLPQS